MDFSVVDSHGSRYENGAVSFESFSSLGIKDAYARLKPNLDIKKIKVNLRRLDSILSAHAPHVDHIDILSIDVEGWELDVVEGLDLQKYQPRVMVIENLFNDDAYRVRLNQKGYSLWTVRAPNDVYVRSGLAGR